ncbi:hypothetical protein GPECTOR_14g238 [Gonium pectorale]|uniref:Uncharacterized protein n=1 Tax=Gonium pectorale TaxID=33097 RepID=A0A150GMH8_GONPE|nr:hypothetical protein GPECTOR_14g238 [Gonium pectorale]|eukprot:KXZ50997.1 hypothetical protein GPECTOR_14g238 [Gonium pectorale]
MGRGPRFGGIACLCSARQRRDWQAEDDDGPHGAQDTEARRLSLPPEPPQQLLKQTPQLDPAAKGDVKPAGLPLHKHALSPQRSSGGLQAYRPGASGASSGSSSAAAAATRAAAVAAVAAAAGGMPASAFATGGQTFSFPDSDSLSSLPASEAVFGLAGRASAAGERLRPAASDGALVAGAGAGAAAAAAAAGGRREACILRPMPAVSGSGASLKGRSGSLRRMPLLATS